MKLKTYSFTLGQTVNLGNFNSARYEVSGTIELTGDDDAAEINELKTFLKEEAREVRAKIKGEENGK